MHVTWWAGAPIMGAVLHQHTSSCAGSAEAQIRQQTDIPASSLRWFCSVLQDLALAQLLQKQLLPYLRASSGNIVVAVERASRVVSTPAPASSLMQGQLCDE